MRVPISHVDLSYRLGFYRIAKKFQRNWPGEASLSFRISLEILARGLGYQDLHELQQSSDTHDPGVASPSQNEVRDSIRKTIVDFCGRKKIAGIDANGVTHLVMSLPLHELFVYKPHRSEVPASREHSGHHAKGAVDALDGQNLAHTPDVLARKHAAAADTRERVRILLERFSPRLSEADLQALMKAAQREESLRDQCLISGLLEGVRLVELLSTRVRDVLVDFSKNVTHVSLRLHPAKASFRPIPVFMPASFGNLVSEYVAQAGLSNDSYLFPAAKDPHAPMREATARRIVAAYFSKIETDRSSRYVYNIRQSVRAHALENLEAWVARMSGHQSKASTLAYLRLPNPEL